MEQLLAAGLGGALGGVLRYQISGLMARLLGEAFPWGTLTVNITGSLLIGLLASLVIAGTLPGGSTAVLLMVGLCGSYTTVSSFSLQTLTLWQQGHKTTAGINIAVSALTCLLAVTIGLLLGRMMT
ncbi:MAG: fluoride efflux transporter CrcB [Marinobacter sp.]|nr:fluoride efflux transporter CrcB [Marinobacter sp.]